MPYKTLEERRAAYRKHPETAARSARKYAETHKAGLQAASKQYREEHAEELRTKKAQYRLENKERIRQQKAASYQRHKLEIRAKQAASRPRLTDEQRQARYEQSAQYVHDDGGVQKKLCSKCLQVKSLDQFPNAKKRMSGKSSHCLLCIRTYRLAYIAANRDKIQARNAAYYQEHLDDYQARSKAYRENNPEKIHAKSKREYATKKAEGRRWSDLFPEQKRENDRTLYHRKIEHYREYRQIHREKRKQQGSEWYATHQKEILAYREAHREETRARGAAWIRANPEKNSARVQRRRARQQDLPATWTNAEQQFMLQYWHDSCAVCGNARGFWWSLANDHWIPLTSATCPGTIVTNMIPLCHGDGGCNNRKTNLEPHTWLVRQFGPKKAAQVEKAIATYFALVATIFPKETAS